MITRPIKHFHKNDPGVPEALPQTLAFLREALGVAALDDLWIFPPLVQGRRERGLVVASAYAEDDRRSVHTVTYLAERTGEGLTVVPRIEEEGVAPSDRLPRMIHGVVHRARRDLGEPRNVSISGCPEAFQTLLDESTREAEGVA